MKKYILSLLWLGTVALGHAGSTVVDSKDVKDMKELQPILAPSETKAFNVYTGFSARNSSWYTYGGIEYALDGDINSTGWFARGFVGGGQYAYNTPLIQGRV